MERVIKKQDSAAQLLTHTARSSTTHTIQHKQGKSTRTPTNSSRQLWSEAACPLSYTVHFSHLPLATGRRFAWMDHSGGACCSFSIRHCAWAWQTGPGGMPLLPAFRCCLGYKSACKHTRALLLQGDVKYVW